MPEEPRVRVVEAMEDVAGLERGGARVRRRHGQPSTAPLIQARAFDVIATLPVLVEEVRGWVEISSPSGPTKRKGTGAVFRSGPAFCSSAGNDVKLSDSVVVLEYGEIGRVSEPAQVRHAGFRLEIRIRLGCLVRAAGAGHLGRIGFVRVPRAVR